MVTFEIVSSRIEPEKNGEKRYVAYMLQVRRDTISDQSRDPNPASVERRYTHFQQLYNDLRNDFPTEMAQLTFPKKVVLGNFKPDLISNRSTGFEALLHMIANESRLRESAATITFFQKPERTEAKRLITEGEHGMALSVLEMSIKLLNKVYTDASHPVLCTLCRLVACADGHDELAVSAERWAVLALRRYASVSDADLLMLYAPLLQVCVQIWSKLGRDKAQLENELNALRRRDMKVDGISLLKAVDRLENA